MKTTLNDRLEQSINKFFILIGADSNFERNMFKYAEKNPNNFKVNTDYKEKVLAAHSQFGFKAITDKLKVLFTKYDVPSIEIGDADLGITSDSIVHKINENIVDDKHIVIIVLMHGSINDANKHQLLLNTNYDLLAPKNDIIESNKLFNNIITGINNKEVKVDFFVTSCKAYAAKDVFLKLPNSLTFTLDSAGINVNSGQQLPNWFSTIKSLTENTNESSLSFQDILPKVSSDCVSGVIFNDGQEIPLIGSDYA